MEKKVDKLYLMQKNTGSVYSTLLLFNINYSICNEQKSPFVRRSRIQQSAKVLHRSFLYIHVSDIIHSGALNQSTVLHRTLQIDL